MDANAADRGCIDLTGDSKNTSTNNDEDWDIDAQRGVHETDGEYIL